MEGMMVPFPEERRFAYDTAAGEKSSRATYTSIEFDRNPDGGGTLLPPLKEKFKEDYRWWLKNVHYAWKGPPVEDEEDGLDYHLITTAYRLLGTMKYKLHPKLADVMQFSTMPFVKDYREEGERIMKNLKGTVYERFLKNDPKVRVKSLDELLEDEEKMKKFQNMIKRLYIKWGVPREHAEMLADLAPIFVKASKAWAEITKRAWKDMVKRGEKLSPYEAAEKMYLKDPDPLSYFDLYAKPEEIEAIHQAHVALYHLLPRMFKEKSGVMDYLDEERA
ncbi:hypothetical protein, partial [Thermococcus sp.]|uniref:hypothetical protein n=1 Tax=Thermococcus sp. TaxID=35749 RepID=UPI00262D06FE